MYLSALAFRCYFLSFLGAAERSDELIQKILPGITAHNMKQEHLTCMECLGINSSMQGENEDAERYLKEAKLISEEIKDSMSLGGSQIWLGWVYYEEGNYKLCRQEWMEAQSIALGLKNRLLLAFVQSKLALLEDEMGNYESAIKIQVEARENFKHFNDQAGIGYATSRLSFTLINMGEYSEAKRFGEEGYQSFKEINHRWGIPVSLCRIGFAEIGLGDYEGAWQNFCEALKLARQSQIQTVILYSLIGIGILLARFRDFERGVEILANVIANPVTPSAYRDIAEKAFAEIEGIISDQVLGQARDKGKDSELEEIIELVPESLVEYQTT
jgi:hypothetical protein